MVVWLIGTCKILLNVHGHHGSLDSTSTSDSDHFFRIHNMSDSLIISPAIKMQVKLVKTGNRNIAWFNAEYASECNVTKLCSRNEIYLHRTQTQEHNIHKAFCHNIQ
jgi:hypothetical protein